MTQISQIMSVPFLYRLLTFILSSTRGGEAEKFALNPSSTNEQVETAHIEAGLAIVLPSQLEKSKSILVGSKATILRLIHIDEAASNHEQCNHGLWRILGDH